MSLNPKQRLTGPELQALGFHKDPLSNHVLYNHPEWFVSYDEQSLPTLDMLLNNAFAQGKHIGKNSVRASIKSALGI